VVLSERARHDPYSGFSFNCLNIGDNLAAGSAWVGFSFPHSSGAFVRRSSKRELTAPPPLLLAPPTDAGLCGDEFEATEHWPPQLYTRETRRMVGDHVFSQNTPIEQRCFGKLSIGVGDYAFDSHPAQRFACRGTSDRACAGAKPPWLAHTSAAAAQTASTGDGGSGGDGTSATDSTAPVENRSFAWSEGNVQASAGGPYTIPYWVLSPKRAELSNLLVVATPSGTHVGFSSLRMEPQFMVLGHSAGTWAAVYATNTTVGKAVQDVNLDTLAAALASEGQILAPPACGSAP
jgi:hypothetical protein